MSQQQTVFVLMAAILSIGVIGYFLILAWEKRTKRQLEVRRKQREIDIEEKQAIRIIKFINAAKNEDLNRCADCITVYKARYGHTPTGVANLWYLNAFLREREEEIATEVAALVYPYDLYK